VQHLLYGTGNLSYPPLHATAFYHSGLPGHDESHGNDSQIHFCCFGPGDDDIGKLKMGLGDINKQELSKSFDAVSFLPIILLPQSVGSIKLASADPKQHPIIDPRYFSHPRDMEVMVEAWKRCRKIASTPPLSDVLDEEVWLDETPNPHPKESDEYIRFALRRGAVTVYHPVGTAKMGAADDTTAVVDPQLRVRGITGLRVADASVMPTVISGNTNAPAIMIGERCAAFLQKA